MGAHHPMLWNRSRILGLALLVISGLIVTGCGGETTDADSPISEAEAIEMAENALMAFNTGDYAAWSRDWSDTMKSAIDEDAFQTFRSQYHGALGDYVEISKVTGGPGGDPGTYRWTYDVEFEQRAYTVWFGFKAGSKRIEGVSFEEPSA